MSAFSTTPSGAINPNLVQQLPFDNVQDPIVRSWLSSFTSSWNERSGLAGDGNSQWLTRLDAQSVALNSIARVFGSNGFDGIPNTPNPTAQQIEDTISNLQDEIRKSLIYQYLETAIGDLDLNAINATISSSFGDAYAAIGLEQEVRTNKDNALASAINQIWSQIGGSTAVINDGQLASVTPSGASATKWTQVVASVTDPNTGQVNATSIKQDLNVYANSANSTFNAIYSVRAQIAVGGQTIVGGFGLSATAGAGSAQGPTIDFGVRADKFFIAATSATPDGTTQENQGNSIPFMVLTSNQFVNGVFYSAGVYIKQATIGTATIGTAKIADAAITNAKIGGDIASTNFSSGSAGWYLSRGGYFEANNIYARGNIRATEVAANIITADQIISGSLNQFFTTTSGAINFTVPLGAQCIRITAYPEGEATYNGKDGSPIISVPVINFYLDGVQKISTQSNSGLFILGCGPGSHSLWALVSPTVFYTGRWFAEIIVR